MPLGHFQAKALHYPDLPIAEVPHPFGGLSLKEVQNVAERCIEDIARMACESKLPGSAEKAADLRAKKREMADDYIEVNRLFRERRWSDGLPIFPPTEALVERLLASTARPRDEVIATIAPGFGAATVEMIAINAAMAGCDPGCLPVLFAALKAATSPEFNLQGIQTTTDPVTVWLIVNGPIAAKLGMNSGTNCLGQGNWANATLGRALRLILQNVGGALPGEMDRATQGQPGKFLFCCAENEQQNPWEPLHVERGFRADQSVVTVVGAEGTLNMNTHVRTADEILRIYADTLPRASGNDYRTGGDPWFIICPEHAQILSAAGLSKADIKQRLWEQSKMSASRMAAPDLELTQLRRRKELGTLLPTTMIPVCASPDRLGIIVAGGEGTHSVHVPSFGNTRSVSREVVC